MLLDCGAGEDSWESLRLKEVQPVHPTGDQSWVFIGGTDVEAETPILWPPDAKSWLIGKDLMLGKIEGRRRRDERMRWLDGVTDTWWTPCVDSSSWWWTGRPGVLRFMGSQRVGHDWVTELNSTTQSYNYIISILWKITNVLLMVLLRPSLPHYCMDTKNREQKNIISSYWII